MMSSTCEDTLTLAIGVASCAQWAPVLEWAHQEQWNLGHDDVQHFMNVDPEGFFVGRKAGHVVTALSVVNHTPDFAFIGHYLTDPEHRHQGYGSTLWRQAIQHAGTRCIGLDAIEAQIPNYRKWGFESCYRVHRVTGMAQPIASPAVAEAPARLTDEMIPAVVALEARHLGYARPRLLAHWFTGAGRQGRVMRDREGAVVSAIGWRRSDDGYRIGPLYAQCASHEIALMAEALNALPAGAQVAIDIPEQATHIMAFVHSLGWVTRYCTDRMYRGMPPHPERNDVAGVFSVEAG